MIWNYKSTFGLTEGKSTRVTHEQIQVSVNSTGVLRAGQKTRNPKPEPGIPEPEPGIPEPEPEIPETRILFGNFG
jgi:hypothetical protein